MDAPRHRVAPPPAAALLPVGLLVGLLVGLQEVGCAARPLPLPAPVPPLDQAAFLAGTWRSVPAASGPDLGSAAAPLVEETWTVAAADAMLGVNRTIVGDEVRAFEFLRIVVDEEGRLVYLASPGGRMPPTEFPRAPGFPSKGVHRQQLVFENPDHDFPRRISYFQMGEPDLLSVRLEGVAEGREVRLEDRWRRVRRP